VWAQQKQTSRKANLLELLRRRDRQVVACLDGGDVLGERGVKVDAETNDGGVNALVGESSDRPGKMSE
jgi:hypothetical protein